MLSGRIGVHVDLSGYAIKVYVEGLIRDINSVLDDIQGEVI